MKNGRMFQDFHPIHCADSNFIAANEDMFNGDPATDVIHLSEYGSIIFFIIINANAGSGAATITVESCDTAVPGTGTAIAFKYWSCTTPDVWSDMATATTAGFSASGSDNMYAIEVSADGLSGTDEFVRLQCTETQSDAVDGAITCIAGRGRYVHEVQGTALV